TELNEQRQNAGFARFHLGSGTRLSFDAIFTGLDLSYTAEPYKPRDLKRWDGTLGTNYSTSADLRFSFQYRYAQGKYPNFTTVDDSGASVITPDNFSRNGVALGVDYAATGASVFHGRVSWAKENHTEISQRDSSFWAADAKWVWTPTGRTQV